MSKEIVSIDFAIIGAGIVGLMLARSLVTKFPNAHIAVFEQSEYLGDHTSGRNSGVLHAGIYYPHQSLKHVLCLRGNELWDDLCKELQIQFQRCGKYIIAKNHEEEEEIEKIYSNALQNQVPSIRRTTREELKNLNSIVFAHSGLYSPRTGIINQAEALYCLKDWLIRRGVSILTRAPINHIEREGDSFLLDSLEYKVRTSLAINCAGLHGVDIRRSLDLVDLKDYWVKGYYLKSRQPKISNHLIYPVPLKNLKGLGVHLTLDLDNSMKFGPNTEDVTSINYSLNDSVLEEMLPYITSLFKTIKPEDLYVDYSGIRPKLKDLNENLVKDFVIHNPIDGYWEFLGIESPGFTAAPAIAEYFIQKI